MQSLTQICTQSNLDIDDARMMLIDIRPDWGTTETVTDSEADLIKQSAAAALPESTGEITPVEGMPIAEQAQFIENASQVLGFPLVMAAMQEIKMVDALEEVKNAVILNAIDTRQAQLNAAIKQRSEVSQKAYMVALTDLAGKLQKPISVVEDMSNAIDENNAQLEALLAQVRAGK